MENWTKTVTTKEYVNWINNTTTLVSACVNLVQNTVSWLAKNGHIIDLKSLFIGFVGSKL